jgi:replicative DNA helicase
MTDHHSHLPPQDLEAEEAILGAMLLSPAAIDKAFGAKLTRSMFYRPAHHHIFDAIVDLFDRDRVDELTVIHWLKERGRLADAGGSANVMMLAERCPVVANARAYAEAVRDAAIRRSLVARGHQIAELGYRESPDTPSLIGEAGRILDEMTDRATAVDDVGVSTAADEFQVFVDALQERFDRGAEFSGLTTGLKALDERTGGLRAGELTIVAGRPGMGKSALAAGIAEHVVFGCGEDVYSVNLEMRERQQIGRLMARAGGVRLSAIRGLPSEQDVEDAAATALRLHEAAKRLHMDRASDLSVAQIRQRARVLNRRLKRQGRSLKLVVVDYLQLITPPSGERNETAQLTIISRGLKSMALELGVHVIALSQLNREVEKRQPPRPMLSDLRGSGSIEQDADSVFFLYRPDYYLGDQTPPDLVGLAELIAAKMREGEPGTDALRWTGERVRFSDWRPVFHVGGVA